MVALLTGGSSGIGRAGASALAAAGWRVYELSRRETEPSAEVSHIRADMTDFASLRQAVDEVLAKEGRIDLLVNNAGAGFFGAVATTGTDEARRLFETNLFGAMELTRLVLPRMIAQGGGRIINVASSAVFFPLPYQSVYSATKAALFVWSQALSGEVAADNVKVTVICPGDVKTGFTDARPRRPSGTDGREARAIAKAEASERGGQSPELIAQAIVKAASAARPPLVVVPGWGYALLEVASRLLPRGWVARLVARIYA